MIILILPLSVSCSDNQESSEQSSTTANIESFTFFDLGHSTKLTENVRNDLREKLGREAIERRSILNLEINNSGFLKKHFPELEALNQKLNYPPRERVVHNTIKLMYRYARKENVPFDYVELVFSDYTKKPILFKIRFEVDDTGIVDALREKYGSPKVVKWDAADGESMFWEQNGDFLIVSLVPDQFGNRDFEIVIYYTKNLEQLNETEKKEKAERERQRSKTVDKAFWVQLSYFWLLTTKEVGKLSAETPGLSGMNGHRRNRMVFEAIRVRYE